MKCMRLVFCALLFVLPGGVQAARADSFAYTFSGPNVSGTIDLTAFPITPTEYLILSVTGTTGGLAITSILPPGTYPILAGFPANDNLLFPVSSTGVFDLAGLSYVLAGGSDFNLYVLDQYSYATGTNFGLITSFAPTSVTPEPASFILMATGALSAFGFGRRKTNV